MRQSLQGTGIGVQRTAENTLNLTMPSNITFAFDSATLTPQAESALNSVAGILNQYPATTITVTGHTDDTGSDSYNQNLSERRAASVANYLGMHGVNLARISQQGMGERMPKFPNTSEGNRSQNRRVELAVVANQAASTQPAAVPGQGYPQPQTGYPQQPGYPPSAPGTYPVPQQAPYPTQPASPRPEVYPTPGTYPQTSPYPTVPGAGGYPSPTAIEPTYPR